MLQDTNENVLKHLSGFISAIFLLSLDGTRVINYAQWKTKEDFDAVFRNPSTQEFMKEVASLAKSEPRSYRVASVHHV